MPQPVNQSTIRGLTTSLTDIFNTRLETLPTNPFFNRTVMETESTTKYVDYAWIMSMGAGMREWIGEREVQEGMLLDTYLIQNRKFELTVRVKVEDIEDGVYAFKSRLQTEDRADAYERRRYDLILDLVRGSFGERADENDEATWFTRGTTLLGPDGVPFFSADHPRGVMRGTNKRIRENGTETYTFDQTGTWTNTSNVPFSKEALRAARTFMRKQKDHYGRPARLNLNLLVVGPNDEDAAVEAVSPSRIVKVETDADGNELRTERNNPLGGAFEVLVLDELGDTNAWFLFDTSRTVKPFIFQNRIRPQFQRTNNVSADAVEGLIDPITFMEDAILFGVRARFGAGYGNPVLGFGSTGNGAVLAGDPLA